MAISGFTVADAIRRVNFRLRSHAAAIPKADKIAAIDEAQHELWRLLVLSDRGWFVVQSQSDTPADDDYFPDLTNGTKEYDLPPNFFQMYYVQASGGAADYWLNFEPMSGKDFKDNRRKTSNVSSTEKQYYYDVVGHDPRRLVMAEDIPSAVSPLGVTLFYVKFLDRLTAETDSIDTVLWPFIGAAADYAAACLAGGVGDTAMEDRLLAKWDAKRMEIQASAEPNKADPSTARQPAIEPARTHTQGAA